MADIRHIIDSIMTDPKFARSSNFRATIYHDLPIIVSADRLVSTTPPKILAMRRLARRGGSEAEIFHAQGTFMEEYEDAAAYPGEFVQYFPTYQQMTDAQLRGYFTWRTKVRRGEVEKTSLSFAFVYVYELLNGIGVGGAEDGFHAMRRFWTGYRGHDPRLDAYLPLWLKDYAVYHNLPPALLQGLADESLEAALDVLFGGGGHEAAAVFAALNDVSSYKLRDSRLYALHPDDVVAAAARVFAAAVVRPAGKRGKSGAEAFFGKLCRSRYAMFKSAVFRPQGIHPDAVYEVSPHQRYECRGGQWTCERLVHYSDNNKRLGAFMKTLDYVMRRHLGIASTLQPGKTNKVLTARIERELRKYFDEKRASAPKVVDIDMSRLPAIRAAALATRDRLLDGTEEGESVPTAAALPEVEESTTEDILTAGERDFLELLLAEQPYGEYLRSRGLMASVVADAINSKLFSRFGDTVIVEEEGKYVVLEEYAEEMKEALPGHSIPAS